VIGVNDVPVRKVLGWAAVILSIAVTLAFLFGLEFFKAWADQNNVKLPIWIFIPIGAIVLFGMVSLVVAFFGPRGRAIRRDHRERMRRLKNFELDGD